MVNVGFIFFLVFYLSDGGYFENFGILLFLKRCFEKIVVVDGGVFSEEGLVKDFIMVL